MKPSRRPAPPAPPPATTAVRAPGAGRLRPAVLALCSTGAALAALALPAALGATVDDLVDRGEVLRTGLLLCTALIAAEVLLDALVALVGGVTTAELTARLRTAVLARVTGCGIRHGEAVATGDLTTRLTANAAESAAVPVSAATAVSAVLLPLGGTVGLFLVDPWAGLSLLVAAPLLVLVLRALVQDTARASADYQSAQAEIAGRLTEALDGIATVRAAGTAAREHARIIEPLGELGTHGHRTWRAQSRAASGAAALLPLLTAVVLAVAGVRAASGALGVGDLLAVSQYAVLAVGLGPLTGALATIARGRAATRRLEPLLALEPVPHRSLTLPPGGPGTLTLRAVEVVRDGVPLLSGVDLTVPGGSCTAVVGRSGSGKSLLAAVAGRLADPDAGTVTLDGVPLDGVDPLRLRDDIAYAFARPALLGATVEDALGYGAEPAPSGERIDTALRDAGADAFVALLPLGVRTPLARAPLSGGEHQRLGLARAFARPARLLILDDATSSLDTVTERWVRGALARRAGSVTRLVVAHRVSSAADADQVVWLDAGRVRAVAPHTTLWHDPAYRALFTQAPEPRAAPDPPPDTAAPGSGGRPAIDDLPEPAHRGGRTGGEVRP
ncbi:ABC transporter ATP-binding protein [Streptomyces sp. NPDC000594]|uniref:ABC transporter ATP-binding protein n=1 Tax=Streptomyces sp. NPDC000594 TaxID=3154261 RepID=UPI00331A6E64